MSRREKLDVLLVGGGAREHALAWKLVQSPRLGRLTAAPGNPGIARLGDCVPVRADAVDEIAALASAREAGLVVIGPEVPLAAGLADRLAAAGIPVFGPTAAAARIESSKAYARRLMSRMGVPQPDYARCRRIDEAESCLDDFARRGRAAAVVKASGLAAGKGAVVCDSLDAARQTAREMLARGSFGEAGAEIVIEERLQGEEASLLILTDGAAAVPLLPAQDYKRVDDGDRGPNTGGMGSYAPAPVLGPDLVAEAMETVVGPTLRGLAEDGAPFRGCLYAGLMRIPEGLKMREGLEAPGGLKVIEFNCRFGDPETQAVLPLMESDLLELFLAVAEGRLAGRQVEWRAGCAVTVVMASGGYPGSFRSGVEIRGVEAAAALPGVSVFHAGTAIRNGTLVTAGGRVLSVTGVGDAFGDAMERAYAGVARIDFAGRHFRTDIAARAAGG